MAKLTQSVVMEGLIVPKANQSLREVWKAFRRGKTWLRVGRKASKRLRLKHSAYGGKAILQWWGPAIKYQIEDSGNVTGMITGALIGHIHRHSKGTVDRIEARFPA